MQQKNPDHSPPPSDPTGRPHDREGSSRRGFLYNLFAGVIGLVALAVPLALGLVTFFSPLRRRSEGALVRVASLEDIPPDGIPRRFPVVARRRDAWSLYPPQPIGAVFLRRTGEDVPPEAVSTICPHLGCAVDFRDNLGRYLCPCHNSTWNADGSRIDPASSPSPRDLDELKVEVKSGQVWVEYRKFRNAISEQVPV